MCMQRESLRDAVLHQMIKLGAKRGAAQEGLVADAGEAVGQAGQREGGVVREGVVADAGEAVGPALPLVSAREVQRSLVG